MTIRRGESWGAKGPRDPAVPVARSDRELHERFCDGATTVHLDGGDFATAFGAFTRARSNSARVTTFVVDAYDVTWTSDTGSVAVLTCHSHCIHGSWWRGDSWWFSAGGYVGGREVLPRSHPNDGIAEVLHVDATMSLRQRYDARRRLRWGTHLPHPDLRVSRAASLTWESRSALPLVVDGTKVGRAMKVHIAVVPDACRVTVAAGVE
jgi:diacylglycerol kinase family enzyme